MYDIVTDAFILAGGAAVTRDWLVSSVLWGDWPMKLMS